MRRGAGHPGGGAQADGRGSVRNIADIGRAIAERHIIRLDLCLAAQFQAGLVKAGIDGLGKFLLLGRIGDAADLAQFGVHHLRQRFVDQQRVVAVDHFPVDLGAGAHRRAARRLFEPGPDRIDLGRIGVADIVKDLGKVGHHIGRDAAFGNHIMDPRLLRDMLAHHVDHHVEAFDAVERRSRLLRGTGGMGGNPVETEFRRTVGQRGAGGGGIFVIGMPVQRDINIVEQAGADHIDLAAAAFFGWRAIETDAPGRAGLFEPFADRDGGFDRSGTEQVMAAGMGGTLALDRGAGGDGVLVDPGQRVIFGQYRDHRAALAKFGGESGRDAGDAGTDFEAVGFERLLQQVAGFLFLISDFRPFPKLPRGVCRFAGPGVDQGRYLGHRVIWLGLNGRRNRCEGEDQGMSDHENLILLAYSLDDCTTGIGEQPPSFEAFAPVFRSIAKMQLAGATFHIATYCWRGIV